jgi:hypothetical protein
MNYDRANRVATAVIAITSTRVRGRAQAQVEALLRNEFLEVAREAANEIRLIDE